MNNLQVSATHKSILGRGPLLFCFVSFFLSLQVGRKHRNETKGQWTPTHTPTQSRNFMTVVTQLKGSQLTRTNIVIVATNYSSRKI